MAPGRDSGREIRIRLASGAPPHPAGAAFSRDAHTARASPTPNPARVGRAERSEAQHRSRGRLVSWQGVGLRLRLSPTASDPTRRRGFFANLESRFPLPASRFPIPDSRFPIPDSRFPIPDSRFPTPDSRLPIPDSRFPDRRTIPRRSRPDSRVIFGCRGKSGLHRARCQVTPGRREPTESATESRPPMAREGSGKGETVR